jgi:hypothetical protein
MNPTPAFRRSRISSRSTGILLLALAAAILPDLAWGQELQAPSAELEVPHFAWEDGDYQRALEGYLAALQAPGGERHLREVALRTGEWYRVAEVAEDGAGVAFSPDGRLALYRVMAEGEAVTHLVDLSDPARPRVAAVLPSGLSGPVVPAALGPGGWLARVRAESTAPVERAREGVEAALSSGDRGATARAREVLARAELAAGSLVLRSGSGGADRVVALPGLQVGPATSLAWAPDVPVLVAGAFLPPTEGGELRSELVILRAPDFAPEPVEGSAGARNPRLLPGGRVLAWEGVESREERDAAGALVRVASTPVLYLRQLEDGRGWTLPGDGWVFSADGTRAAFLEPGSAGTRLGVVTLDPTGRAGSAPNPRALAEFATPVANPVLSPDGSLVAYQRMPKDDWEVFVLATDGPAGERQVTVEVQHDLLPRFLDDSTLAVLKGEARHRRVYTYDLETGVREKLFHNNTVRTIAPEYEWSWSPDGRFLLVVADRDGNTVSPERGVYLLDRGATVTRDEVVARLTASLEGERALRTLSERLFAPLDADIRPLTEAVSPARIYHYARDLYALGSKHISQPGNARAIDYLVETLRGWGYEPELQWFEPQSGIRTANVIAKLPGRVDPELVYVVSSHFDSHARGPGADDNSSGTTALLEAARVMRDHPQPATIHFAFFTGEESGLLGSREYVRRVTAGEERVVGALNNDMVGWTNDHRLDNTIRYSNPGIRDIQHGAAMRYSGLITYDALYYRSTDAAAFYEAWGDIVGGIGSYPVLGNPNYHQFGDRLETISQQLVAEVSRTTVASLVQLATSPARPTGLRIGDRRGWQAELHWDPAPESTVERYIVQITRPDGRVETLEATRPGIGVQDLEPGVRIEVRAVNRAGRESWDAARVEVP